jgi:hypothetical protein
MKGSATKSSRRFEHSQDLKDWAEQIQKRAARTLQPNTAADGNICSE